MSKGRVLAKGPRVQNIGYRLFQLSPTRGKKIQYDVKTAVTIKVKIPL